MCSKQTIAVLLLVATAACGRKEAPKPPIQIIPARTTDLSLHLRGNELLLTFTYPLTTIAGGALGGVQAVEVWEMTRELPVATLQLAGEEGEEEDGDEGIADDDRSQDADEDEGAADDDSGDDPGEEEAPAPVFLERIVDSAIRFPSGMTRLEDLAPVDPAEFAATARIRLTLAGAELESAVAGDKITARLSLDEISSRDRIRVLSYAVKTLSTRGLGSAFSNVVTAARRDPPESPADFTVTPGAGGIELGWTFAGRGPERPESAEIGEEGLPAGGGTPAEAAGESESEDASKIEAFHIYRRDARARFYGPPLRRAGKDDRTFTDRSARFGESYIYAVVSVLRSFPLVESPLSAEREVDYEDRFAPPAPRDLVLFAEPRSIRLLWNASSASDVAGYFVERRAGDGDWVQLNPEPIQELELVDRNITPGQTYGYRVSAIDRSDNRGPVSEVAEVRAP